MFCVGCGLLVWLLARTTSSLNIAAISLFGRRHFLLGSPPPFYSKQECAEKGIINDTCSFKVHLVSGSPLPAVLIVLKDKETVKFNVHIGNVVIVLHG